MDHRQILRILATGRIVVGAALTVAPGLAGGRWIGPIAADPRVKVMVRAMGIRDLALGAGLLHALGAGEPAATWARLGALSDVVDTAATIAGAKAIGPLAAAPTIAVAATSAVVHTVCAGHLD